MQLNGIEFIMHIPDDTETGKKLKSVLQKTNGSLKANGYEVSVKMNMLTVHTFNTDATTKELLTENCEEKLVDILDSLEKALSGEVE